MNYKLLLLLLLLLSVSLYSIKTGWISSETFERIYVTVVTANVGLMVNVSIPTSGLVYYCPSDLVNVSNNLTNLGNINITGNLFSRILDSNNNQVHSESWNNINISIDETKNYNTSYKIPDDPVIGTYNAESNFSYNGELAYDSKTFEVRKGIGTFLVSPSSISVTIEPGNSTTRDITLLLQEACEDTIVFLNTTPNFIGWVTFIPNNVLVTPFATNKTTVNITVPEFTAPGMYGGTIFAYADDPYLNYQLRTINLNITVSGLAFSVNVTIPPEKKQVCQEEGISGIIDISKNQPGLVYVNMSYQIRNLTGFVFDERNETVQINETLRTIQTFTAPSILGYYEFLATLQYNQLIVDGSDTFQVIECIPPPIPPRPTPSPPPLPTYALTLRLSTDILSVIRGNRTSFIAYVNNTGTSLAQGVKMSINGIPLTWIEVMPMETSIPVGETREFLVFINVPEDAEVGIRRLEVKARNRVESNVELLTLVIGRDPKEIADLLFLEMERVRALANESLLVEECLDVSMIKSYYKDAEFARENGLKEYNLGNFVKASHWFEYAIPVYMKVQRLVDMTLEIEIERLRTTNFIAPPTFDQEGEYRRAKSYLEEKNYQRICEPISRMRTVMMTGLIFWPVFIVVLLVLVVIAVIIYRKKRRIEREIILGRVKERLEGKESDHIHLYPHYMAISRIKRFLRKEEK